MRNMIDFTNLPDRPWGVCSPLDPLIRLLEVNEILYVNFNQATRDVILWKIGPNTTRNHRGWPHVLSEQKAN